MTHEEYQRLLNLISDEQNKLLHEAKELEARGQEQAATQAFLRAITCRQLLWKVIQAFGSFSRRREP